MKKLLFTLILTAISSGIALAAPAYKIDSDHTYANFKISHMGFSTLYGQLGKVGGAVAMDRQGDDNHVDITIDSTSVYTGNAKRDQHLRNDKGFFSVSEYPKIQYQSTAVDFQGQDKAIVHGKLTMHGHTNPVTLHVTRIHCGQNPIEKSLYTCGFDAHASLKRSDYGMNKPLGIFLIGYVDNE